MPLLTPPGRLRTNGRLRAVGIRDERLRLAWQPSATPPADAETVIEIESSASDGSRRSLSTAVVPPLATEHVIDAPADQFILWRAGLRQGGNTVWSERAEIVQAIDFAAHGARWIGHPAVTDEDTGAVWFSASVSVPGPGPERALLHLAAPGVVEVRVDGRAMDEVLAPGYSHPFDELPATTVDLGFLEPGERLITIEVASGPYRVAPSAERYAKLTLRSHPLGLLAVVQRIDGAGRVHAVASSPDFRTGRSATIGTNWYGGEDHDTGVAEPWDAVGVTPIVLGDSGLHPLWWPQHPPIAVAESLDPVAVSLGTEGGAVYDFGRNIGGFPHISWRPAETVRTLEMWPAEHRRDSGISQASTGSPIYDTVRIARGGAGEWRPRFAYHGFRFVQLAGDGARIGDGVSVTADVARATNERVGEFSSSDPFVDWLYSAVTVAVEGNMFSVFTDCPHREKLGWLEQLHLCFGAITRSFDAEAHLRSVLHHVRTAQLPSGAIPNIAPELVDFTGHGFLGDEDAFRFDVNWGGVIALVPLRHYAEYGDVRVLVENRESLLRYLEHLRSVEHDGVIDFGLGDWIALDHSYPRALVATFGYRRVLRAAERIGGILNDEHLIAASRDSLARVEQALLDWRISSSPSQTELALLTTLADERGDELTASELFRALRDRVARDGNAFTVGEVSFEPVVAAYHRRGLDDELLDILRRPDVPGYGMQYARGATALAETWSSDGGPEGEGSNNHFMLGMIHHWVTDNVAGLRQHPDSIGWSCALVEPTFLRSLEAARTAHQSASGPYAVAWRRLAEGAVEVEVDVPPAGRAIVRLPGSADREIGPGRHVLTVITAVTEEVS